MTNDGVVRFIEDRKAGLSYQEIAEKYGTTKRIVRYYCGKALKAGQVTAEEIHWRATEQPLRYSAAEYDDHWIKRVIQNILVTDTGCWIWQKQLTTSGYGQTSYRAKTIMVHRKMFQITRRIALDRTQYVCHECDTPACCNPAHLRLGDHTSNLRESVDKGRNYEARRDHCERGHPFSGENLIIRKNANGNPRRVCRACERIRARMAIGWTEEQAATLPKTPPGHRPVAGKKAA